MPILRLGLVDRGARPANLEAYFRRYHEDTMLSRTQFRGEKDDEWIRVTEIQDRSVSVLQGLLRDFGFYPQGEVDGIFGYRTLSAVRLFQEYVRAVEGIPEIGTPDGVVGQKTNGHLLRWRSDRLRADWTKFSPQSPSPGHRYWMEVLKTFQQVNLTRPVNRVLSLINTFPSPTDTLRVNAWKFDPRDLNLVGIRRQEWRSTQERQNDDLFVLLANGSSFVFYGSTDPNPRMADRPDEPYLIRGQHRYRFGWHKLSDSLRTYRAFRPVGPGVLICRDSTRDDAFTDEDLASGLRANGTINIHWSGAGTSNWSAGCQVIAGARYLNHTGRKIDCASFAARSYGDLPDKTRAAYNVLLDLLTVFAPDVSVRGGSSLYYTLLYERDLKLEVSPQQTLAGAALASLGQLAGYDSRKLAEDTSIDTLVNRLVRNV